VLGLGDTAAVDDACSSVNVPHGNANDLQRTATDDATAADLRRSAKRMPPTLLQRNEFTRRSPVTPNVRHERQFQGGEAGLKLSARWRC
jgi:hypothetical protein